MPKKRKSLLEGFLEMAKRYTEEEFIEEWNKEPRTHCAICGRRKTDCPNPGACNKD